MLQRPDNILNFIKRSMENWNTKLASYVKLLAKVNLRKSLFQRDRLSVAVAVRDLYDIPHKILRKVRSECTLKNGDKLKYLLYMWMA